MSVALPARCFGRILGLALVVLAAFSATGARSQDNPKSLEVDLQLVMAVDISMSMDPEEQRLQREGYVEAFRDPALHAAIASGRLKRIAVTYFEWAGQSITRTLMPWTVVDGPASAQAFADALAEKPISRERFTSVSAALRYAGNQFATSPFRSQRRVVDVSGDGPNNHGPPVVPEREALLASGIVINGLPILLKRGYSNFDLDNLEEYYRDCVSGGEGSFVMPITRTEEFLSATRQKLLREIAAVVEPVPRLTRVGLWQAAETTDCMIGEKMWQRYMERR